MVLPKENFFLAVEKFSSSNEFPLEVQTERNGKFLLKKSGLFAQKMEKPHLSVPKTQCQNGGQVQNRFR